MTKHASMQSTSCDNVGYHVNHGLAQRIVHNGGGEFTGHEFKEICRAFGGLKDPQSTANNPQSNAIDERMHQTVGNVLRFLL